MINKWAVRLFRPRTNSFLTLVEYATHEAEAKTRALFRVGLKDWNVIGCKVL